MVDQDDIQSLLNTARQHTDAVIQKRGIDPNKDDPRSTGELLDLCEAKLHKSSSNGETAGQQENLGEEGFTLCQLQTARYYSELSRKNLGTPPVVEDPRPLCELIDLLGARAQGKIIDANFTVAPELEDRIEPLVEHYSPGGSPNSVEFGPSKK